MFVAIISRKFPMASCSSGRRASRAINIEYISEQGFYLQELAERRQSKIDAIEKEELRSEVDELKRTVAELQDRLLSCCPSETTVQEGSSSPNNTE